jgi:hypothetical protein
MTQYKHTITAHSFSEQDIQAHIRVGFFMNSGANTLQNIAVSFAEHCNRHCTPTLSKDI